MRRKLTHHVDPKRTEEIARFVSRSVVSVATPGSFPWAVATGKTYLENFDAAGDHVLARSRRARSGLAGMDGYGLAARLRAAPVTKAIGLIALTRLRA